MKVNYFNQKLFLFLVLCLACGLLSFRPLPATADLNDSGRYAASFFSMCKADTLFDGKDISYKIFNFAFSSICFLHSPQLYLFLTSILTSLVFLSLSSVGEGKLFVILAAFFNACQFEMMTNALRQSFSLAFMFVAIYLILHGKKKSGLLLGIITVIMHSSNAPYLPFLIFMCFRDYLVNISKKSILIIFSVIILLVFLLAVITDAFVYLNYLQAIYVDQLGPAFLVFMLLPTYGLFFIRYYLSKENISQLEKEHFIYSSLLYIICYFLFPAIVYRLPMTLIPLQLYYMTNAKRVKVNEGFFIFLFMLLHLLTYLFLSSRVVDAVFFIQSNNY